MALTKRRSILTIALSFLLLAAFTTAILILNRTTTQKVNHQLDTLATRLAPEPPSPPTHYGIVIEDLTVEEKVIKPNQFLADMLLPYNIPYLTIDELAQKAKDVFDVRKLGEGKPYTILASAEPPHTAQYFIYDPNPYYYVVYDLRDTLDVYKVEREIHTRQRTASGVIATSLWNTMMDNQLHPELAVQMEDIFGWSVDFHHLYQGDRFRLIYDEEYIGNQVVGIGQIYGASFEHRGNHYHGFYYQHPNSNEPYGHYYDEEARPLKKAFLKAPVKYARISSPYNLRRFHPVLKRVRPHLGTDYAAPHGTPIYAVADGIIERAGYTKGNGNFIKIKHDKTYSTQYLHMSKFASGMRVGVRVKQSQVIGYVGSTGLATGPHVCFRFWKNGKQVNHRSLKLPPPEPMPEKYISDFNVLRDSIKPLVESIPYMTAEEIALQHSLHEDSLYAEIIPIP